MRLPEELAAEILVGNDNYTNFLLGKPIAEDKLAQDIADAIRLAYIEGIERGKQEVKNGTIAEID